ncbi:MAG: ATP-binding cassette domain-containing protein, partial [Rhodospirillales bacterium]|nr:ATP-binding cassette domain-containing protein [Rhodospirillales bacterium]
MSGGILVARDLEKRFFQPGWGWLGGKKLDVQALRGVSLSLVEGETLALVGESGCGKTTLAKTLGLLLPPDGGSIQFEGEPLESGAGRSALAPFRRRIQMIFQDPYGSLNPRLTAGEIIAEPLIIHHLGNARERQEKIEEAAGWVGLDKSDLGRYPHQFSGGQRQRIAIARAIIPEPSLIIADEPLSALDMSVQSQAINLLMYLGRVRNLTYLFITHDLGVVRYMADRVAVMYLGRIVELAPAGALFESPLHPYSRALIQA